MNLTAAEVRRLLELTQKSASTLTDAEKSELAALQAKAAVAKDAETKSSDSAEMSEADLKKAVEAAVKSATTNSLTEDQVKAIVGEAVKGIKAPQVDTLELAKQVAASVTASQKTITSDDVKSIVTEALKNTRAGSKMVHEDNSAPEIEFPIAHRSGNLSIDQKQLLNVMTKGEAFINEGISETQLKQAEYRGQIQEKTIMRKIQTKALTTTGTGTGAEFMNTTLSSTLLARMYMESKLAAALAGTEVQMPTNPFNYPLSTTRPKFRLAAEGVAPASSTPGTAGLALNAVKLTGIVDYSYEADEDSIIAILPHTLSQLGVSAAETLEDAMVNGDTDSTHQDSDSHAVGPTHSGKAFNGFRKLTRGQADLLLSFASGGLSATNAGLLRACLGRWGLNPDNLLWVTGVKGWNTIVQLPETLTAEKTGNPGTARILSGLAPNLYGIDIVPSAAVREDLNASGVYDGAVTTKGSILLVWKPGWLQGVRRGFTIETDSDKKAQTRSVIASFRRDFKPIEGLDKSKAVAMGYNF